MEIKGNEILPVSSVDEVWLYRVIPVNKKKNILHHGSQCICENACTVHDGLKCTKQVMMRKLLHPSGVNSLGEGSSVTL